MGQADEAALIVDAPRRVGSGQTRRDCFAQVQTDKVALGGADLLADDDRELGRSDLAGGERAVDALVVGDRQVGQAAADGRLDDRFGLGERIE
jgi:hypothetical protein